MIGNRKLVLDTWCEVYNLLEPWCDDIFWQFDQHEIQKDAIYLIGREQYNLNRDCIRELVETDYIRVVLSNPAEGSDTMRNQCRYIYKNCDLVMAHKILIIGGGDMDPAWPYLQYDSFMTKILDYEENLQAQAHCDQIYSNTNKPYKFLFLNGRHRQHRQYLLSRWHNNGLLSQSLWTNLDTKSGMVQSLPQKYEISKYHPGIDSVKQNSFIKYELFGGEWGEIYVRPEPYVDTYFSMVTETVFDYPYSFRTEKIWKPIFMAHPWIVAANAGYYRDIKNLGFATFNHLLDEGFDNIDNDQDRIERIAQVVEDLCRQDLPAFLREAQATCKYNQQHLVELASEIKPEFSRRFFQFIKKYKFDE